MPILAQEAVEAVAFRAAIVPTPWVVGIAKIRAEIRKYSNQIMARHELMFGMPASNYPDWRKWAQELIEQAKRCSWDEYGYEQAALDQCITMLSYDNENAFANNVNVVCHGVKYKKYLLKLC